MCNCAARRPAGPSYWRRYCRRSWLSRLFPLLQPCRDAAQSEKTPWLLPTASQIVDRVESICGQIPPTSACAVSQLEMFIWLSSCAFWLNSSITFPISGDTESIASLKAKPSALLAVALSIATISEALMKEKLPLNRSMPPHPARALGKLKIEGRHAFLRETRPDVAKRVIAGRLPLKGRRTGDVGSTTRIVEEAVHLRGDVCASNADEGEMRPATMRKASACNLPAKRAAGPTCFVHQ